MALAVVGIAAGAFLAGATVPSFAPYLDRRASTPVVINGPIAGDRTAAVAPESEYGLAQAPNGTADEGFSVRPGTQDGTIVLQLPHWAQETTQWYGLGERAWQEWRSWTDPGDDQSAEPRAPAYGERRDWSHEDRYGASPRFGRRDDGFDGDDRDWGYADRDSEAGSAEDFVGPMRQDLRQYRREQHDEESADAAARAAERARDAARDVREAEDDAQ